MESPIANVDMAAAWDGDEGDDWSRDWERFDRSARHYHRLLLEAAAIAPGDRVLDIGCGNGQTTRDAARAASSGSALGVDLSSKMLDRARELAEREGVTNATFTQADAQTYAFEPDAHDVVISRNGAMFFADPVAAFTNIGAGTSTGGRLALVAWRRIEDNEWLQCVRTALAAGRDLPSPPAGLPGPFGLADVDRTTSVLTAAGFDGVDLTAVDEPLWFGDDADDAFSFISRTGIVRGLTAELAASQRAEVLDALHDAVAEHAGDGGVEFGSAAWLITARKR